MKEGLNEVVGPDLSDNGLQRSDSKYFQFLALCLCPDSKRVSNAQVQEDSCFSSPTSRRFRQSAARSNRVIRFYLGGIFLEMTLLSTENCHETTTSEAPNRIPCDSACFRLPVSVCFRLFPSVSTQKLRGTPQSSSKSERCSPDACLQFLHSQVPEIETQRRSRCLS